MNKDIELRADAPAHQRKAGNDTSSHARTNELIDPKSDWSRWINEEGRPRTFDPRTGGDIRYHGDNRGAGFGDYDDKWIDWNPASPEEWGEFARGQVTIQTSGPMTDIWAVKLAELGVERETVRTRHQTAFICTVTYGQWKAIEELEHQSRAAIAAHQEAQRAGHHAKRSPKPRKRWWRTLGGS